jgi:gliding motility-associated-like protein
MKRVIPLLLLLSGCCLEVWAQPCGLQDTLNIPTNSTPTFDFEVFNIFNDDLSDPNQGICAVEIEFLHQYVDKLELTLISPSGQSVTLIGPDTDEQFAFTAFARWDISFLTCGDPNVGPDPGSLQQWDNAQVGNFVVGGQYNGSYYPFDGCLQDFNTGPVNGTWTISVNNNPSPYPGAILGFRLVFCDERGLDCCFAAAGNLQQEDILTCVGDSSLLLTPEPTYQGTPPDTINYGYTYLIGEDSILTAYDSMPDLTSFPPGRYQLCGFSYRRSDVDSFPQPDGLLTIDSLRNNLSGLLPDFCAEVTNNCIWIEIVPQPTETNLQETICGGDTLVVGDSSLTATGVYEIVLPSFAGCDSTVNVQLQVVPTAFTNIDTTICTGESIAIGDSLYDSGGLYVDTLLSSQFCDSIITLDLTVLDTAFFDTTLTICRGDQFVVGDSILTESGNYEIGLPSAEGCDSLVRLDLTVVEVDALIGLPDTLSCAMPEVILDGSGSSPAASIAFQWQQSDGTLLGSSATQAVTEAGGYILGVSRIENGVTCTVYDTLAVAIDTLSPIADAGLPDTLRCNQPNLTIGGGNTSTGSDFLYAWSTTDGQFSGPTDQLTATVDSAGRYTLVVTDTVNGCTDSASVDIASNFVVPVAITVGDTSLTCSRTSVTLDGAASSAGPAIEYQWTVDGSAAVLGNTPTLNVNNGGAYQLLVSDTSNGCADSATVNVVYDTLAPEATILLPDTLNCANLTAGLQATVTQAGNTPVFNWQTAAGNIISGSDSLLALVDQPAVYEFIVERSDNGCRDTASVTVLQTVNDIIAQVAPPDTLDCNNNEVSLDGTASTSGEDIIYEWSSQNGQFVGDSLSPVVTVSIGTEYTFIVTDTFTRCADTLTVNVPVDALAPIANAGPNRELTCDSTSVTLDGSGSSQNGSFDYDWLEVETTTLIAIDELQPQVSEPGRYLLIVTDATNGCFDTSSVWVESIVDTPLVQIALPDTLNCLRTTVQLDASSSASGTVYSYSWIANNGGVLESGEDTQFPTVSTPGLYELTIENDSTGCTNSATVSVVDTLSQVEAAVQLSDTLSCDITSVTANALPAANGPDVIYEWSVDTVANAIDLSDPGNYELIALDTFTRCADTLSFFLPADTIAPFAEAGNGFELTCSVLEGTLDASASATDNVVYSWSGPCVVSGADSIQAVVNCIGTYTLLVQDTLNGCTSMDTVVVAQDAALPTATITGDYAVTCDSLTQTLNATASTQGVDFVYQWSGPSILSGGQSLQPVVDQGGEYILVVQDTVTDCSSTANVTVAWDTISPIASAGIAEVLNCDSLTIEVGGGESSIGPQYTYEWTGPSAGFVTDSLSPFVEVSLPGDYTIMVTDTTNGCSASSTTTVFLLDDPPNVEAGPDQQLDCDNPTAVLDGSASDDNFNTLYEWRGPCLLSPADSSQVTVDCEGVYILEITDMATGCSAEDTVVVTRDSLLPNAQLLDTLALSCFTGTAVLDGSASDGEQFEWFFNGDPLPVSGLMPVVDSTGLYTLIAFNDEGGCSDTAQSVVVLDCDIDILIATPDTLTCARTEVVLDATATAAEGDLVYQWEVPAGNCIVAGQGSAQLTVRCPGTYMLTVTNTVVGVSDTLSVEVVLNDTPPIAEAGANVLLTCDMPTNTLSAAGSTTGPQMGYRWEKLEDEFFEKDSFNITVDDDGTYFLIVTDSITGCTAQDVVSVQRSDDQHDINFGSLLIPCLQDTFWLTAFIEPASNNYTYAWEGDIILDAADSSSVLVDTSGTLRLTVVDTSDACVSVREIELRQQECIPCIEIAPADSITCVVDSVLVSAAYCETCLGCTLEWTGPAGGILSADDELEIWVGRSGTYTLTATDTLGFTDVEQVVVIENTEPPTVALGPDRRLTCEQPTVTLSMAAEPEENWSFQWSSLANGVLPTDTFPSLMVDQAGTYTLEVVDLGTGCRATDAAVVSIDTIRPQADAGDDRQLDCSANAVELDGSDSDFGLGLAYAWTGPAGANIAGVNTFNPSVNTAGWYVLTVRDTTNGCFSQDSVLVTASTGLPPVPDLTDTVLSCRNPEILLIGELPSGGNFSSCWYRLDVNGNPTGPCVTDLFIPVSITGRFRFEVTNTDNDCTNAVDVNITEDFDAPEVTVPDSLLLDCPPDTLSLPAQVTPAGLPYTYAWSGPTGGVISGANAATATVVDTGIYSLLVENDLNGCTSEAFVTVVPNENIPELSIGPDTSLNCRRLSVRLSASFSTESGNADLLWQTGNGQIVSGNTSPNPLVNAPGVYVLQLTDPVSGCRVQDSILVADEAFVPDAQIDSVLLELNCRADSLLLDATPSLSGSGGALAYEWRRGAFEVIGDEVQQWIRTAGNYRLIVTDEESGCRDTLLFTVTTNFTPPQVSLPAADLLDCEQTSITLSPDTPASTDGIQWAWLGPNGDTISGANFSLEVTEPGVYTLIVTSEDNGCSAQDAVEVEANIQPPAILIDAPQDLSCDRTEVTLDGSGSTVGTGITYLWTTDNGVLSGAVDENTATAVAPGWYVLQVTNAENGCANLDSVEVIQTSAVIVDVLWEVLPPSCPGDRDGQIVLDTVLGGTAPFFYALGESPLTENTTFSGLAPGDYTVRIEDANGCTWEGMVAIPEAEGVSVELGEDITINLGGQDTIVPIIEPLPYDSIWWWPNDGKPEGADYIVSPTMSTLYQVWVQNERGCVATDQIRVVVIDDLPVYLPNVFSPNGDEQNDVFMVFADESIQQIASFRIFDRWGDMVFEAEDFAPNDPAFGWDGTLRGYEMNSAVFAYTLEVVLADGRTEWKTGEVLLLR